MHACWSCWCRPHLPQQFYKMLLPSVLYQSTTFQGGAQQALGAAGHISPQLSLSWAGQSWAPTRSPYSALGAGPLDDARKAMAAFPGLQQQRQQQAPVGAAALALAARPQLRSLLPVVAYQPKEGQHFSDVLRSAGRKALGGGIPGAAAMAIQVGAPGAVVEADDRPPASQTLLAARWDPP